MLALKIVFLCVCIPVHSLAHNKGPHDAGNQLTHHKMEVSSLGHVAPAVNSSTSQTSRAQDADDVVTVTTADVNRQAQSFAAITDLDISKAEVMDSAGTMGCVDPPPIWMPPMWKPIFRVIDDALAPIVELFEKEDVTEEVKAPLLASLSLKLPKDLEDCVLKASYSDFSDWKKTLEAELKKGKEDKENLSNYAAAITFFKNCKAEIDAQLQLPQLQGNRKFVVESSLKIVTIEEEFLNVVMELLPNEKQPDVTSKTGRSTSSYLSRMAIAARSRFAA